MRDVDCWNALHAERIDVDTVVPLLEELAKAPVQARAMYLSAVMPLLTHRAAKVRAAAVRALAGTTGIEARRAVAARLDDNNADVREAALATLSTQSAFNPATFAPAVFHRRVEVRRRALEIAPPNVPVAQLVLLLGEAAHAPDVRALLDRRAHEGGTVLGLLAARRHGLMPVDEVRSRLQRVPWSDKPTEVLQGMPFATIADGHVATPATLRAYLTALVHTDPLADVLTLLWVRSGVPSDAAPIVEMLVRARREGRLKDPEHRRVAVAATQVLLMLGSDGEASPRMLALCGLAVPVLLLLVNEASRKRALEAIIDVPRPDDAGKAPNLKLFMDAGALHHSVGGADKTLDVHALSGALRLLTDTPYQKLREAIPTSDVAQAFWDAGEPPVHLVSLPPRSPGDREAYRALVKGIIERMRTAAPNVIAELAIALPSEGGFILEELEKRRAGLAGRAMALLLADGRSTLDELSRHRLERNAALLAGQLTAASLPAAITQAARVLSSSAAAVVPVARTSAVAVLRSCSRALLGGAMEGLPADVTRAIVAALEQQLLPVEMEQAWAAALQHSSVDEALAWAAPRRDVKDAPRAIGPALAEQIARATPEELPLLASVFLREPLTGLVDALASRADAPDLPKSARLCAALLASHDPPHRVADAFQHAVVETPPFLSAIDAALGDEDTRRDLPLLATAAGIDGARQSVRFEQACRNAPGGVRAIVELALALPSPFLSWKVMRAVSFVVRTWTFQRKALLDTLDARCGELLFEIIAGLVEPRPPTTRALFDGASAVRLLATQLVVLVHGGGRPNVCVDEVRQRLVELEPDVDAGLRGILAPLVTWPVRAPSSKPSPPSIDSARERLRSVDAHVVKAAVDELMKAGRPGLDATVETLAAAAANPLLHLRAIIERTILVPTTGARLLRDDVDPEVRYRVAVRLDEWDVAVDAVASPCARPWFTVDDMKVLGAHVPSRIRARELARSPHAAAYSDAVWALISFWLDERSDAAREGLLAFLAIDSARDPALRAEAAAALLQGAVFVAPVVLASVLDVAIAHVTRHEVLLRASIPRGVWLEVIAAAALAGDGTLDARLETLMEERRVDDDVAAAIALHLLKRGPDKDEAGPLFNVLRRARFVPDPRVDALREAVRWGVRQARVLMGRPVTVEFIHDAFGYTRLHQPRIFINPLPLLKGERGGDDVVRGLMVHEIGHHLYHADELGKRCWADAQKEGIGSLLNLVADEHLERNLRAESEVYGDHLKVLAAYAFQHVSRDVYLDLLLHHLGPRAAAVLTRAGLMPGNGHGSVHVELGKLLGELSGHSSFARFMRALRMGLGARGADDKVKAALALFEKKQFRQSKMDWLLEITRELKRIFGDETKLLDTFGLHETMEAGEGELIEEGFSPDELQREMDPGRKNTGKIEKPRFNNGPDESFEPIEQVVSLPHSPVEHRAVAEQGKRATAALRRVFDELGVRLVTEHKRLAGRSLDRQGLGGAILKRDPRLLVRRKPVPATDLFVGIVVDCSGSMASEHSMDKARVFATSLAEAARGKAGVDVRIFGFTDTIIYEAGDAERCAAHALTAGGGNNDSAGLWHAAVQAKRSKRKKKLLVMVSDGMPTECSATSLRSLSQRLERGGLLTAQVAVRPIGEKMFKHYIEILGDDVDDAARRFARTISRLVRKTMGR